MSVATETELGEIVLAGDLLGNDAMNPTLKPVGVIPGTYTNAKIFVDAKGRVLHAESQTDQEVLDQIDLNQPIPDATYTEKGFVQIHEHSGLVIDENGVLSLATASDLVFGGVQIGTGFDIDVDGVLSVPNPLDFSGILAATETEYGGIIAGDGFDIDVDGVLSVPDASYNVSGILNLSNKFTANNGEIDLNINDATYSENGYVQIGSGFENTPGILNVNGLNALLSTSSTIDNVMDANLAFSTTNITLTNNTLNLFSLPILYGRKNVFGNIIIPNNLDELNIIINEPVINWSINGVDFEDPPIPSVDNVMMDSFIIENNFNKPINIGPTGQDSFTVSSETLSTFTFNFQGAVLLNDGRVFCVPRNSTTARIYDPITDTLTTPSGNYPGSNAFWGGVLLNDGRVFCVPFNSTTARIYDPITDTLTTPSGTYPGSYAFSGAVLLNDGRVFCVPRDSTTARIYDPITDTLTTPSGTYPGSQVFQGAVLLNDGRVFCVPNNSTTARIYDPITDTLTTPSGTYEIAGFWGGVLLNDGRVFCVPNNSTTARIYDPITDTLTTPSGTYPGSQAFHDAVLLNDGRVFCVPFNSTTARIYDPITDTLTTSVGEYTISVKNFGAALLNDGRVFRLGGENIYIYNPSTDFSIQNITNNYVIIEASLVLKYPFNQNNNPNTSITYKLSLFN